MRILMISTLCFPRNIGGVENHIFYLAKSLIELGHHVEVLVPIVDDTAREKYSINSINFQGIPLHEIYVGGIPRFLKRVRVRFAGQSKLGMLVAFFSKISFQLVSHKIARVALQLMRDGNMQLLHQHDFSANILTTKIVSKHYPTILTNHTGEFLYINERKYLRPLLRFTLSHYRHIIGPSPELAGVPYFANKATYIPNGVDTAFFKPTNEPTRTRMRQELGFSPGNFIVLCPRRWAPTKGIIYLCKAIRQVTEKVPNIIFLFAGSDYEGYPNYRKEIEGVLTNIKLAGFNNFKLLGNLNAEQLRALYQISDVVVIPSLMEATSLAALEAMAIACPVLATRVGGMPGIIFNRETGFLVEPASSTALADALQEICDMHDGVRKIIGRAGRQLVLEKYSWQKIAQDTSHVYGELLHKR